MKTSTLAVSLLAAACLMGVPACGKKTTKAPSSAQATATEHGHSHDDGHSHDGSDSHDHAVDHSVAGHAHGAGPHDGTIADWGGGKYHVEFTVDHDKQQATVFVLGGDEKTPTPLAVEEIELFIKDPQMQVVLKATPQQGDPAGSASRYVGSHEKLAVVQEYAGTITGVIDGTPYSGDFQEVAHGH